LNLLNKDQYFRISPEFINALPFILQVPIDTTPNDIYLLGQQYYYGDTMPNNKNKQ
jgi:hypothetical protein